MLFILLVGILVFFMYIKYTKENLAVTNYKKWLVIHIIVSFASANMCFCLVPAVLGKTAQSLTEYSGLHWFAHIPILNGLLLNHPVFSFVLSGALALAAFIMCVVTLYHIFFEY
jgi:hypothetical protein